MHLDKQKTTVDGDTVNQTLSLKQTGIHVAQKDFKYLG